MEALINTIQELGAASLDLLWLPIAIWTAIALLAAGAFKLYEHKISAAYHYHSRVALLWGLTVGVMGSLLYVLLPAATSGTGAEVTAFIVIKNPITVTAAGPSASLNWANPGLWLGILTICTGIIAAGALLKLIGDFISLNLFAKKLSCRDLGIDPKLSSTNKAMLEKFSNKVRLSFSEQVDIPCTFGWYHKRIVLPVEFQERTEELNMALRHELTHIQNSDYLLNTSVQTIKALFFFHPLVHRLAIGIEEYREISCDQQVLQDSRISRKKYAELLFELSPKTVFNPSAAVSMAVQFSTLKKRIQTMKQSAPTLPSLKWSLSLMLAATLTITGLMACSDIEEGGITQTEVEDTQMQLDQAPNDQEPLIVLDGEITEMDGVMGRLKPKYIESIDILKGEKAREEYGKKGANGVIKITLSDHEKAMADLRTDEEVKALYERRKKGVRADDNEEIFVAVEDAPQLKGGLRELQKHVKYPESCRRAEIEGRVTLQFVVNKQGDAEDVEILRGIGGGCDEAAKKAVEQYADFEPGMQRGEAVNVRFSLPIFFKLAGNDENNDSADDSEMNSELLDHSESDVVLDQLTVTAYANQTNENKGTYPAVYVSDEFRNLSTD